MVRRTFPIGFRWTAPAFLTSEKSVVSSTPRRIIMPTTTRTKPVRKGIRHPQLIRSSLGRRATKYMTVVESTRASGLATCGADP